MEFIEFELSDVGELAEADRAQLNWLVESIIAARGVVYCDPTQGIQFPGNDRFQPSDDSSPWYPCTQGDSVLIDLDHDYRTSTGISNQAVSINLATILGDLKTRGYISGYTFTSMRYGDDFLISSSKPFPKHWILELSEVSFSSFIQLRETCIAYAEGQKYQNDSVTKKGRFYYDDACLVLHRDYCGKVLLLKNRRRNNRAALLTAAFDPRHEFGSFISSDSINNVLSGEQLYHAASDLNRDIEEIFGVKDFFEIDHQYSWVKRTQR